VAQGGGKGAGMKCRSGQRRPGLGTVNVGQARAGLASPESVHI
jgi:hypothetical protein